MSILLDSKSSHYRSVSIGNKRPLLDSDCLIYTAYGPKTTFVLEYQNFNA